MARKTGYMDMERAESEKCHKESMEWLKAAQANSRTLHNEHMAKLKAQQAESKEIRKKFIATNQEYAKTLGKFDDNRKRRSER